METIEKTLKTVGTVVVDVRTPAEYMRGHIAGSINIPVHEIPDRLGEFKNMRHVVVCCMSGARSYAASIFLKQNNIDCADGGSWQIVNSYLNN